MLYIIKVNGRKYLFFMKEVSTMADLDLGNKDVNAELAETAAPDADVKGKKGRKKEKKQKKEKELSPKKKAKLEKKAEKAEIKALRKEAKIHSLKIEKRRARWTRLLAIILILAVLATTGILGYTFFGILTGSIGSGDSSGASAQTSSSSSSGSSTPANTTPSNTASSNTASSNTASSNTSGGGSEPASNASGGNSSADTTAAADAGDLSTPAGVVAYYKTAHAKTLAEAKSVSKVYENTLNYNTVLEIGDNATIAKIAQSLMSSFLKENTEKTDYSGADIASMFPGQNAQNLTADMLSEATCTDNGDNYTIVLKINSTEEAPDDGTKTSCILTTVNESDVTSAAGSMVKLEGLANDYIGGNITATVDKASGRITHIETDSPSYMKFSKAGVAIISVDNCRIGLEYLTKWDVNY